MFLNMFPAQTSLIPIQIALARFLENRGWRVIFQNYPYWYMGTTPFRYLTGPVIPVTLILLHRLFPSVSLFNLFYWLVGLSWSIGSVGVYLLARELILFKEIPASLSKKFVLTAFLACFFHFFGPIVPFLFRFSNGSSLIAFSFLPLILFQYIKLLRNWSRRQAIILILLIAIDLLIDSSIFSSLVLGLAAVLLATQSWGQIEKKIKKTSSLFIISLLLVTIWYSPGYWFTLLLAPSFGGAAAVKVIEWLGKLLPTALALTLAILSLNFFKKKNTLRDFCFYWLFIFSFLTLIRFLSDPDFWLDWSAYGMELQFGLSIFGGFLVNRFLERMLYQKSKIRDQKYKLNIKNILVLICIFVVYSLIFTLVLNKCVFNTFRKDITEIAEYRIGVKLKEIVKPGERVFLSGSSVFWLNAFFDIPQVRGGVDQASLDPDWRKAAWEIREGIEIKKSLTWLKDLNIGYVVVHTISSREFFHDFKNTEKFENTRGLKMIFNKYGDRIYQVQPFNIK